MTLGEYYTPDWLAARVCEAAIDDPSQQRVLDPACGSGSFLFHAVRRFIAAARAAHVGSDQLARQAVQHVVGMDIHPVAVIIARVTYLLALGTEALEARRGEVAIPVYLGDALQWSVKKTLAHEELEVHVPAPKRRRHNPQRNMNWKPYCGSPLPSRRTQICLLRLSRRCCKQATAVRLPPT